LIDLSYDYFEKNQLDAIFYPTMPMLPFKIDDWTGPELKGIHNGKEVKHFEKSTHNSRVISNLNFPSISLPTRKPGEGLPVGMEVAAPTGDDRRLIAIARVIEKVLLQQ